MRHTNATLAATVAAALATIGGCSTPSDTSGTTDVRTLDPNEEVTITWWTGQ
jgi:hypothetical protein